MSAWLSSPTQLTVGMFSGPPLPDCNNPLLPNTKTFRRLPSDPTHQPIPFPSRRPSPEVLRSVASPWLNNHQCITAAQNVVSLDGLQGMVQDPENARRRSFPDQPAHSSVRTSPSVSLLDSHGALGHKPVGVFPVHTQKPQTIVQTRLN